MYTIVHYTLQPFSLISFAYRKFVMYDGIINTYCKINLRNVFHIGPMVDREATS